jgi:cell pole-organizing protein PopZ
MSSANPKVHEPSMEEILASIRRIISDDQDTFASPRPSADLYAVPQDEPDSQENNPEAASSENATQDASTAPAEHDDAAQVETVQPSILAGSTPRYDTPPSNPATASSALLSHSVSASVSSAFGRLEPRTPLPGPRSLEDTVREMLRPMLKAWLDQNLPGIVERLVQAEIERVTRA